MLKLKFTNQSLSWNKIEIQNTYLFLFSRFFSTFGKTIYNFSISLFILYLTKSGTSFAISLVVGTLPKFLFSFQGGFLADRYNKKNIILCTDLSLGILFGALFTYSTFNDIPIFILYLSNFIVGVINAIFNVTMNDSLPNIVGKDKLTPLNSWLTIATTIPEIIAPIIGGILYYNNNLKPFLFLAIISNILSFILDYFIKFKNSDKIASSSCSNIVSIKELLNYFSQNHSLLFIIALACLINFFLAFGYSVPMPYIVNNYLHMGTSEYGILQAANTTGALIGALLLPMIAVKKNLMQKLLSSTISIGTIFIIYGFLAKSYMGINKTTLFLIYICLFFLFAFVLISINIPLKVLLQKNIPEEIRGKSIGLMFSCMSVATPIGQITSGYVINIMPPYLLPIISGLFLYIYYLILRSKTKTEDCL